ncbi:hypothetical protein JCM10207_005972 [Rhodosporidiobolus poonsookiae]
MSDAPPAATATPRTSVELPQPLPDVTRFVHAHHPPPPSLRRATLRFLRSAAGRDAALRLLQFSLRLVVYLRKRTFPRSFSTRLLALVSTLAAIRRLFAFAALLSSLRDTLSASSSSLAGKAPSPPYLSLTTLLTLIRTLLETLSTLTDTAYLLSRLTLLPVSPSRSQYIDKLSDVTALGAAACAAALVQRRRREVTLAGRAARRAAAEDERRLEELEFWEDTHEKKEGKKGVKREEEKVREEEKTLRDRIRAGRKAIRGLREELAGLRWERAKVVAEGVFALYDTLDLETTAEGAKAWSGIVSSGIEFSQVWAEHLASTLPRPAAQ